MGCGGSKQQAAAAAPAKVPEGDFKVTLERTAEETLGLSIVQMTDKTYRVNGVKEEGLVPDWNKKNENTPDVLVKENDLIVAVNDVFGDLEAMQKQLTSQKVTMAIKRPEVAAPATEAPPAEAAPAADAPAADAAAPDPDAAAADAAAADAAATEKVAEPSAEPSAEPAPAAAESEAAAAAEGQTAAEPVAQTTEGAALAAEGGEAAETAEKAAEPVAEPVTEPGAVAESAEEANASTIIVDAGDLEVATQVAPETRKCGFC